MDSLLTLGGFPEPFLGGSAKEAARWRIGYAARLVQEDVRDLERVRELERIELLCDRLGAVAGGIVSLNSLRKDLEVAFETVRSWIAILERLEAVFRVAPYGPPRIRTVKKEAKLYFWDWARAESEAARFENLIALHLLRLVHWARDVEGEPLELRDFRTRMGHEVDFLLLRRRRPVARHRGQAGRAGDGCRHAVSSRAGRGAVRIPGAPARPPRAARRRHRDVTGAARVGRATAGQSAVGGCQSGARRSMRSTTLKS